MAQNIEIKYGSFTIGTSSSSMYINNFSETHSYRKYSITVDVLVVGTTDETFKDNLRAIENALEQDNQTLTINFGPSGSQQEHRNFNPTNFTGLNVRTTLNKRGSDLDTDRSRVYTWTCTMDLPADSSSDNYRREASWSLSFDSSSRMTLSFNGTYTAGYPSSTATKAVGNYLAGTDGVEDWIASIFTDLNTLYGSITIQSNDFELIDEKVNQHDDDDHLMDFSRTYRQRLFPDISGGNSASIINASVSFTRSNTNRHGNKQKGPVRVSVRYSCNVDTETTTYTGLASLWSGSIKPWLVAQAKVRWSGSVSAVESENTDIDVTGNAISSNFTLVIFNGTGSIVKEDVTITITYDERKTFLDIWDGKEGTYSVFSPGRAITSNTNSTIVSINTSPPPPGDPPDPAGASGGFWNRTNLNQSIGNEWVGQDQDGSGGSVPFNEITTTYSISSRWVSTARVLQVPGTVVSTGTVLKTRGAKSGGN